MSDLFAHVGPDKITLSPRERDTLRLLAQGHTNAEIGARMHISEATVKTHLDDAGIKIGARRRVLLARWWWEHHER